MQPLLQWKSNKYYILLACVCSCTYSSMQFAWAILSHVPRPHLHYFSTLPHKTSRFSKKKKFWTQNVFLDFLYNSSHQPDATVFQLIILTFIYSSTCFGRSPAHHQELNDCSSSLWFYIRIVVTAVLCLWSGRL